MELVGSAELVVQVVRVAAAERHYAETGAEAEHALVASVGC